MFAWANRCADVATVPCGRRRAPRERFIAGQVPGPREDCMKPTTRLRRFRAPLLTHVAMALPGPGAGGADRLPRDQDRDQSVLRPDEGRRLRRRRPNSASNSVRFAGKQDGDADTQIAAINPASPAVPRVSC